MVKKNSTTKAVTIAEMPINLKAILTVDQKKAFVKVIEEEFGRQATRYDVVRQERKAKALEAYRKRVGFYRIKDELTKAEGKVKDLKERIENLGLDTSGDRRTYYGDRSKLPANQQKAMEELDKVITVCSTSFDAYQKKAKIISRLWLATTYAEAQVILNEVLGNGDIPPITDVKAITFQAE